jgi:hypothetical protein
MEGMNTSVQEAAGDSIARAAAYLGAAWQDHIQHEFEAHSVEDTQEVDWQGTRYVLGESGYYLPDSTRANWSMGGQYNQGKEGVATAYEWFLNLPPVVPLLVLWVGGVALIGACVLVSYALISALMRVVAGAF